MKKTKLLIATAALSLAAVAAGTVSTMAWFQATANASVNAVATTASVAGANASLEVQNLYLHLTMKPYTESVNLTSSDGETYGVVNSKLVKADKSSGTNVDYFTVEAKWSSDDDSVVTLSSAEQAKIAAGNITFNITHNTGSRIRLAQGTEAPAVSGTTLGATAQVKVSWAASGESLTYEIKVGNGSLAEYPANKIYYSIAGQLATASDAATDWGTAAGLSAGSDLTSNILDAHFVGETATVETTVGLGAALKLNIA